MSIPAGYTVMPSGFFMKTSDGSGPYIIDATGTVYSASQTVISGSSAINLNDGTGLPINSLSAGAGANGLMVAPSATNYITSTNNSTAAQLTASSTFTGVVESIFNQQAAQIELTCDQPITLTVNQYIDSGGTQLSASIVILIPASTPFCRCYNLPGNYFKITAQNTGASTTTTLVINTTYGTLPSVDQNLNLPVGLGDGASATLGAKADTTATWYSTTASLIAMIKLTVAAFVGAGSHVYTYVNGTLSTDAWTFLGTTRTKTYTYNGSNQLTNETDWV